jgi:hypothetical protein
MGTAMTTIENTARKLASDLASLGWRKRVKVRGSLANMIRQ